jgi:hypothetical protein
MDSSIESFRVRRVILSYFLEDGSIQLVEPTQENSGILQGIFMRRHKFESRDGTTFDPENLKCGTEISLYSRTFRIYAMDDFTRGFYRDMGLDPGTEEPLPDDGFSVSKSESHRTSPPSVPEDVIRQRALVEVLFGGSVINHKTKQYLENDGKILSFDCHWDDDSDGGFRHFFNLHWFLADDSVELIEVFPKSSSCAAARHAFMKRTPIEAVRPFLKPNNIMIGESLEILGRTMLLTSCDAFTRKYYKDMLCIDQPADINEKAESQTLSVRQDVEKLVPRRPRSDMKKQEFAGVTLRFTAKRTDAEKDRSYIISFFPVDDSIAVWEKPMRNSGIVAGRFAERGVKLKPDSNPYSVSDLVIGGTLTISGVHFLLEEPDNFTKEWLKHS